MSDTPNIPDPELRARLTGSIAQSNLYMFEEITRRTVSRLTECLTESLMDTTDLALFVHQIANIHLRVLVELEKLDTIRNIEAARCFDQAFTDMQAIAFRVEQVVRRYAALPPQPQYVAVEDIDSFMEERKK